MNKQFQATITTLDNHRAIILSYYPPNGQQLPIAITELNSVVENERMPVSYDYHKPSIARPYPWIQIVAAPGISISMDNWPEEPWEPSTENPRVSIIRVQDPSIIPPVGRIIRRSFLLNRYEEGDRGDSYAPSTYHLPLDIPVSYAQITPFEQGVEIFHPASFSLVTIRVNDKTTNHQDPEDAKQRFAFIYHEDIDLPTLQTPLFTIFITKYVDIEIRDSRTGRQPVDDALHGLRFFYQIWEGDFEAISEFADPINEPGWGQRKELVPYIKEGERFLTTMVDIAIGLIPVFGDLVDLGEFVYAVKTGKDKWGHDVSPAQLAIMGFFSIVPLLGVGAAKAFRRLPTEASLVEKQLKEAGLDPKSELQAMVAAQKAVRAGRRLDPALQQQVAKVIKKIDSNNFRQLDDVIDASGKSFNHSEIQRFYRKYLARKQKEGEIPFSPRDWLMRLSRRGSLLSKVEQILGPNFKEGIRLARGGPRIRTSTIPAPSGSRASLLDDAIDRVLLDKRKLLERLRNAVREGVQTSSSVGRMINEGHFRILKGNVAEVLSSSIQLNILKRIPHKDAVLVEGVFARTVTETGSLSPEKLFSDNLIVRFLPNKKMEILGVIEVKSGYSGGMEARLQIFDWIERRIDDGTQIIISPNAKITNKQGKRIKVPPDRTFTYFPSNPGDPRVVNLMSAKRFLITAKGRSALGINSSSKTANVPETIDLKLTSEELDWLAGQLAEKLRLGEAD